MNSIAGWKSKYAMSFVCAICHCLLFIASASAQISNKPNPPESDSAISQPSANPVEGNPNEINELKRQLADQQKQIDELREMLQKQAKLAEEARAKAESETQPIASTGSSISGQVASMVPMLPPASLSANQPPAALQASSSSTSQAAAPKSELPMALKSFKPIGTFYLSYQNGMQNSGTNTTIHYSKYQLKRGYFGADVGVTSYLTSRFVGDVTQDATGDVKVRAKYLYGKFHGKGNNAFTGPYMEFGLTHMPWLDWEEAMNGFRMQDTMFLERNGIFNSADVGFIVGADIGGSLSSDYKSNVNSHYAGRYGSWQVGVFNGGGYHAADQNKNKAFQARLSLRPIPASIPGLQITFFGVVGKGNKPDTGGAQPPKWESGTAMISYESRYFTITGQGYLGIGNQGGSAIESDGSAAHQSGFSVFAAVRVPTPHFGEKISLIGRFDEFNSNTRIYNDLQRRYIAGIAWHMYKNNIWLIDYERTSHSLSTLEAEDRFQVTLQTVF